MARVLVVDDEANIRKVLAALLRKEGHEALTAENGEEGLELALAEADDIDAIVTDLKMPKLDGLSLLREIQRKAREIPVIVITAHGTVDTAVDAMKAGAFDYLQKPFDQDDLRLVIDKAICSRALARDEISPADSPDGALGVLAASPSMAKIVQIIERVAATPSTVLITGESGTGKEVVASALHEQSDRREKPFIRINCAAIPRELMEAELFGHEKGAFTGAVASKPGRFELADGGTLFLDEIAEIPPEMQVKILRAIQESEFERVGGVKTLQVDVRLIAATNRDIEAEIAAGRFREDLYYRLNVVPLDLPPLRGRRDDIPFLVRSFVERFNERLGLEVSGVDDAAMDLLQRYPWPGNIRELENVMERTFLFLDGDTIGPADLPDSIRARAEGAPRDGQPDLEALRQVFDSGGSASMKDIVRAASQDLERDLIVSALEATGHNVTQAARRLKISRKSLQLKMKDLGLRDRDESTA
ncbi:MAG: sigma-54 dependent transcriptional regulator [Deltaproteobacteria bacterium]|nr:sigma-54 dependent transcriptional regulator [Deltaproteobacteria bacterium]